MIRALVSTLLGMTGLIMSVLGVFGTPIIVTLTPWALGYFRFNFLFSWCFYVEIR